MELHKKILTSLCRLCGCEGSITAKFTRKDDINRDILSSLNIDVEADVEGVHPPKICSTCRMKLSRWRKHKNQKKRDLQPPPIEVKSFVPHDNNCAVCQEDQWDINNIIYFFQQKGWYAWQDTLGVVAIFVDQGGNGILKKVSVLGRKVECFVLGNKLDLQFASLQEVSEKFMDATICPGNADFQVLSAKFKDDGLYTQNGTIIARVESSFYDGLRLQAGKSSIRHVNCEFLVAEDVAAASNRTLSLCKVCTVYRSTLQRTESKGTSSKHFESVPTKYLSKNELKAKVDQLSRDIVNLQQKNRKFKEKIEGLIREEGVKVNAAEGDALATIIKAAQAGVESSLPKGSYSELLWKEQLKASSAPSKQMRWHPAVIRWAVAIHTKSASAYNVIRESGFLTLPHPSTLYKYTHFTDPKTGINPDILLRFLKDYKISSLPEHARYVSLLIDEMKISSGLAFSKSSGRLVGVCDIGTVANDMEKFEQRCISGSEKEPELASHILVYMVRGITSGLKFPVAYYATSSLTGNELYEMTCECVKCVDLMGLKVLCLVSDGATSNRKLYQIFGGISEDELNPKYFCKSWFRQYADEKMYFICDTPHLVKTIRNNFENSNWNRKTRNLLFRGQRIQWTQLIALLEWDLGIDRVTPGLRLVPRLTYEHLHLTPSLRMKVRLAAQVLSGSVANGLEMMHKPGLDSTVLFLRQVNKFFDCLNVTRMDQGRRSRNDNLMPYTSVDDARFQWLLEDFLGFWREWVREGEEVEGLTKKERSQLCPSRPTIAGIFITVHSFVEMTKKLLALEGVKFVLSDKFNQDPLEEFFAKQRGAGGHHDNPSMEQFGHAFVRNIAAGSLIRGSGRANVRTRDVAQQNISDEPLPKRKKSNRFGTSKEAPH